MEIKEVYEELQATVIYDFNDGDAHVDFKAFEIVGYESDNGKDYNIPIYSVDNDNTRDTDKTENYLNGMVKWDGCSHVYYGEKDNGGYIHMCGAQSFKNLSALLLKIYQRCYEIGGFTEEPL